MADFTTDLAAPQAQGAQPLAPVQGVDFGGAFNLLEGIGKVFGENLKDKRKQEAELAKQNIISEYTKAQTALHEARASGSLQPNEVNARYRSNASKFVASYPQYVKEFKEINAFLEGGTEIGETLQIENELQDARKAQTNAAVQAGFYLHDNMTDQERNKVLDAHRQVVVADEEFKRMASRNAETRSQNAEQRTASDFETKERTTQLLTQIGNSRMEAMQGVVASLQRRMQSGEDPNVLRIELESQFNEIKGGITTASGKFPELASGWNSLFNNMYEYGIKAINPTSRADELETQLKITMTKAKMAAVADQETLAVVTASNLFGNNLPANVLPVNKAGIRAINSVMAMSVGAPAPSVITSPEEAKAAASMFYSSIDALRAGKVQDKQAAVKEAGTFVNTFLKQFPIADVYAMDVQKLQPLMDMVDSPQFAYAVEQGMVSAAAGESATGVYNRLYQQPLVREVQERYNSKILGDMRGKTHSDVFDIEFTGAGVKFKVNPEKLNKGVDAEWYKRVTLPDAKVQEQALTKLIRIGAHLAGTTNYAKYWEENKHTLMPQVYPDPRELQPQDVTTKDGKEVIYLGGPLNRSSSFMPTGVGQRGVKGKIEGAQEAPQKPVSRSVDDMTSEPTTLPFGRENQLPAQIEDLDKGEVAAQEGRFGDANIKALQGEIAKAKKAGNTEIVPILEQELKALQSR